MTDDSDMDTNTTSREETETRIPPPRPLVRPVAGRMIGGVAAGLAAYLCVPLNLVRLGFAVTTFIGGLGIALYLAGWLLIPDETEHESVAKRSFDNLSGPSWIGIGLMVLAAVIILDNLTFLEGSLLWATVLVVAGVLLYRGEFPGQPPPGRPTPPSPPSQGVTEAPPPPADQDEDGDEQPPPPATYSPPPPSTPPAERRPPSLLGRLTMGIGLLALGILAVLDNALTGFDADPRHYLALATVVLGVGLVVGAWAGRARWMILLGIFLIPPLAASPLAEVDWDEGFQQSVTPTSASELDDRYQIPAGSLHIDLREIPWDGQSLSVTAEVMAGEIRIVVPDGVAITGTASSGVGVVDTPGEERVEVGSDLTLDEPGELGTIDLDLEMGAGVIEIRRAEPTDEFSGFGSDQARESSEDRNTTILERSR